MKWWNFEKNHWTRSSFYGQNENSTNIDSFTISKKKKKKKWRYDVLIFLVLSFILLMPIVSDDTKGEGNLHYQTFDRSVSFCYWSLINICSALDKSLWIAFHLYLFRILEYQRGVSFVILWCTLVVKNCCYNIS